MLSGALLNSAMLGIVRYLTIADAAQSGPLARTALVAFGVVSLLVGALFIVRQNGIKRLMAYSSVEHMGVLRSASASADRSASPARSTTCSIIR